MEDLSPETVIVWLGGGLALVLLNGGHLPSGISQSQQVGTMPAEAFTSPATQQVQQPPTANLPQSGGQVDEVEVSLATQTATVYKGGQPVKAYPVGIGRPDTPTPTGTFSVEYMEKNPTYNSPSGQSIPPGTNNPLGSRWVGFHTNDIGEYGFHEGAMGQSSSGCLHMNQGDLEDLYNQVSPGTKVVVR
jgi:lipoprotein-anchoring transpeptidase ErfK/SrfK